MHQNNEKKKYRNVKNETEIHHTNVKSRFNIHLVMSYLVSLVGKTQHNTIQSHKSNSIHTNMYDVINIEELSAT